MPYCFMKFSQFQAILFIKRECLMEKTPVGQLRLKTEAT